MSSAQARPRALVTGASAGIGTAYAERLARDGYDVVLVARRRERLEELAERLRRETGGHAEVLAADLTDAEALGRVEARVTDDEALTLVVNNAGFGAYRPFAEVEPAVIDALINVHIRAVARLTRAALPGMVRRGSGGIINVASLLALSGAVPPNPLPYRATYAGAKAFMMVVYAGPRGRTDRHRGPRAGVPPWNRWRRSSTRCRGWTSAACPGWRRPTWSRRRSPRSREGKSYASRPWTIPRRSSGSPRCSARCSERVHTDARPTLPARHGVARPRAGRAVSRSRARKDLERRNANAPSRTQIDMMTGGESWTLERCSRNSSREASRSSSTRSERSRTRTRAACPTRRSRRSSGRSAISRTSNATFLKRAGVTVSVPDNYPELFKGGQRGRGRVSSARAGRAGARRHARRAHGRGRRGRPRRRERGAARPVEEPRRHVRVRERPPLVPRRQDHVASGAAREAQAVRIDRRSRREPNRANAGAPGATARPEAPA